MMDLKNHTERLYTALKGNRRKGIKNPFELAKVRIIGRRINGC